MTLGNKYDVVIIGAGVSGTALLYVLSKYTNIKRVAILEQYKEPAQVNSNSKYNSQTLHFGDIETNYNYETASKVKLGAEMVKNYMERINKMDGVYRKPNKMVLAVGDEEIKKIERRYEEFKNLFPKIKIIRRQELIEIDPNIVKDRRKDENIAALFTEDGYTIDYGKLSKSFMQKALEEDCQIDVFLSEEVNSINKDDGCEIHTDKKILKASVVVVAAGAHSLYFANLLDYGKEFSIFPIAGNFYFSKKTLNSKVYTAQLEKLPFAAIHGDPEVYNPAITRFGPTATFVPLLERRNFKTIWPYLRDFGLRRCTIVTGVKILSDRDIFKYILKNLFFVIPFVGKRLFLKEARKIIPSLKIGDISLAKGYGGLRPQVINIKKNELAHGEAKIYGDKIIFNITPSPGASKCLKNAEIDTKKIIDFLGGEFIFDKEKLKQELKS